MALIHASKQDSGWQAKPRGRQGTDERIAKQSQLISAGKCLGFNDLSAVLGSFQNGILNVTLSPIGYDPLPARPISPEGRIGKPVVTQICYIRNFVKSLFCTSSFGL